MSGSRGAPVALRSPALAWSWPDALRGLAYAAPAAVMTALSPEAGVPLAVGVLPACLLPLPGPRRARAVIAAVGSLAGVCLFLGGALAHLPLALTAAVLVLVVVAGALATTRAPSGQLLLVLAAPLVAVGLSYGDDWSHPVGAALLLVLGSAYAWLVSLLWPSRPAVPRPSRPLPDRPTMLRYGLLLGTGAALAYVLAATYGVDHPGWAPAACLLVARPATGLLRTRAVGRIVAVVVGALAAIAVIEVQAGSVVLAVLVALAVVGAAATRTSRWYVTSAFTTFLVLLLLLHPDPGQAAPRLGERVAETVVGVGLAVLLGVVVPQALAGRGTSSSSR